MTENEFYFKALSELKCPESTAKSQNTLAAIKDVKAKIRRDLFGLSINETSARELDFFERGTVGEMSCGVWQNSTVLPLFKMYAYTWWRGELVALQNQPYVPDVTNAAPFNPQAYDYAIRAADVYKANVIARLSILSAAQTITHSFFSENVGGLFTIKDNEAGLSTLLAVGTQISLKPIGGAYAAHEITDVLANGGQFRVADALADGVYVAVYQFERPGAWANWPLRG